MDKSKFNNKKEWRKFGIGLAIILCLVGTLQMVFDRELYLYFYSASPIIVLISLFFPILIKPLFMLFSYLGAGLGWLTTRLILILFFYFLLFPLGLFLKLIGKDFLGLKFDKTAETYWLKRKITQFAKKDYENQY